MSAGEWEQTEQTELWSLPLTQLRKLVNIDCSQSASEPLIMEPPIHTTHTLRPTSGLCTRPVDLAPDYCILLGPAPDYVLGSAPSTTRLCTQRLGFAPSYWAFEKRQGFHSTTYSVFYPDIEVPHTPKSNRANTIETIMHNCATSD